MCSFELARPNCKRDCSQCCEYSLQGSGTAVRLSEFVQEIEYALFSQASFAIGQKPAFLPGKANCTVCVLEVILAVVFIPETLFQRPRRNTMPQKPPCARSAAFGLTVLASLAG